MQNMLISKSGTEYPLVFVRKYFCFWKYKPLQETLDFCIGSNFNGKH